MAFLGSGFTQMALVESQIKAAIESLPSQHPVGHQPFVSKKKEARRKRQEEARRLAELQTAAFHEIEFDIPASTQPTQAYSDLAELEREMRAQLGLDVPTQTASPAPVVAKPKPKRTPLKAKPMIPTPEPVKHTEKPVTQIVKRQLEVLLQVARADGTEVPFYHCDPSLSHLEAELNASKKARGYGLRVLSTLSITTKESIRTRDTQ